MPLKTPWPANYFVGFSGRSAEGDVLLSFAKYQKQNGITDYREREIAFAEWWAKYPTVVQTLKEGDIRNRPFWNKTFVSCEKYLKGAQAIDPTAVIVEQVLGFLGAQFPCVRRLHSEEMIPIVQSALNGDTPIRFDERWESRDRYTKLFLFGPYLWKATQEELATEPEHFRLLFLEAVDEDRLRFERLKNKFSGLAGAKLERSREPIPENVRIFVWRRDGGKCVRCGSNERLEFDHIIPLAEGGGNTERNLQLLCEPCNRAKSRSI